MAEKFVGVSAMTLVYENKKHNRCKETFFWNQDSSAFQVLSGSLTPPVQQAAIASAPLTASSMPQTFVWSHKRGPDVRQRLLFNDIQAMDGHVRTRSPSEAAYDLQQVLGWKITLLMAWLDIVEIYSFWPGLINGVTSLSIYVWLPAVAFGCTFCDSIFNITMLLNAKHTRHDLCASVELFNTYIYPVMLDAATNLQFIAWQFMCRRLKCWQLNAKRSSYLLHMMHQ